MLKQTPKNFKQLFLLEFTKELIRSTITYKELRIKKEVREVVHEKPIKQRLPRKDLFKREVLRGAVKEKIKRDFETVSQLKKEEEILPEFKKYSLKKPLTPKAPFPYGIPAPLQIPESRLPKTVEYLRPTMGLRTIDLGKLNPLVKDRLVRVIECNGPDERIVVMGAMGRKSTKITLTKAEIDDIIKRFSQAAKIPVNEGVFRIVFGNLILSAIISEIIGSKFLIRKMAPGLGFM
jgi:hypothetical protein